MTELLRKLSISSNPTPLQIDIRTAEPVFILGRNGSGKSALVHTLRTQIGEKVIYLPGSRPTYFDSESLTLTPAARRDLTQSMRSWDSSPDIRWRSFSGTSRNEKAVHDLQAAEVQYKIDAADEIGREGASSPAVDRLQSGNSPLDRVNALMAQAGLPVRMTIQSAELRATQSGNTYSYARMSDGERSALVLAAEVVSAEAASIFLIDEPELHLHPSIVVPLINALISERADCGFVICTHELALPGSAHSSKILLVRGCTLHHGNFSSWDIDVIANSEEIPESLRVDLLGSRRKILFIEGTSSSLDQPLYALLFPTATIRARDNCREVMRAVAGLRSSPALHRAEAFGLVDRDGMSQESAEELPDGVYALPAFSVESLYYSAETISAVAAQQASTLGESAEALALDAKQRAITSLTPASRQHLASRIAERKMRDLAIRSLPDREAMIQGNSDPINISVASPYPNELARIEELVEAGNFDAIVARYPIRESAFINAISTALRFPTKQDYERAAITRVGLDDRLRSSLREKFGPLLPNLE